MTLTSELLAAAAVIFGIIGIIGCMVPVIPGPPISFIGLILLQFSSFADYSFLFLASMAIAVAVVTALDFVFPVIGTKKFGGTKRGIWGASIGLILGLFFPPVGIIAGPFIGALVGEITGGMKWDEALLPSLGSLIGVISGIIAKLIVSGLIFYYIASEIIVTLGYKLH